MTVAHRDPLAAFTLDSSSPRTASRVSRLRAEHSSQSRVGATRTRSITGQLGHTLVTNGTAMPN